MRKYPTLLLVLAVGFASAGVISACGTKTVTSTGANGQSTVSTVKNIHFAKTKFLLHAGLAVGAFHRYIYKPLKSGGFKSTAKGQKATIFKAVAAAIFAYHEIKVARDDAMSSDLLRTKLVQPLDAFLAKVKSLPSLVKSGNFGSLGSAATAFDALKGAAGKAGVNLKDLPTPSLGG